MDREKQINILSEDEFDLLVIGGGINGAGIAVVNVGFRTSPFVEQLL
ncbi:unnamed protein product, partial [marine sediment metagenome]